MPSGSSLSGADVYLSRRHRAGRPRARPWYSLAEPAGYRVVQGSITNALRHAGGAPVRVEVRYEDDALVAEVRNRSGWPVPGPPPRAVSRVVRRCLLRGRRSRSGEP
ncbi:hypothetical protein GCM10022223_60590 [Kineosporia mesophila]|uniref:Uncharacterized protein n=1 Tax=Kineosporia mesophila TaxID=566012 RepID=A0ABP7AJT1_9ACTN